MFNHTAGSFEGGILYLIDLSSQKRGSVEQVKIIDKTNHTSSLLATMPGSSMNGLTPAQTQAQVQESQTPGYPDVDIVDLVRFASQQLYAPERLMPSHPSIYRTPLRVKSLQSLYRGGELQSIPLASWKGAGLYVTAVKIQNKTMADLTLDPRLFRGQWRSRTLQYPGVSRYQSESDTTTVYLVSDRPFHESLWF
ncbi:MAG: DUF3438 family protein [gamma proteobacterium symbiont of Lucinoma myriamae]|nr:DUF3438 family protein [gamma proteobacterium symbiont of Lucinoma myriamae]MCU7819823.1 DUF3438 family protein [gamma proteobacterium symbiont of Lucinoma myriamae]MCU7833353.1 DUF3438 family protein [gamma proteobacterium symbiont of Lucinoma myriamae]